MDIFGLEPSAPSSRFSAVAWGFRSARLLHVAVRLNLFTTLEDRPCDAFMLAKRLGTDGDMTERLLVALAGLELVRHDMDMWRNTLPASLYLVKGQPLYQGNVIELAAQEWDRYTHLERLIREGRGESRFAFGEDGNSQAHYLNAIHGLTVAGLAQRLARLIPLAGRRTLLDVGGAPGTWSIALAQRHAGVRITLLDNENSVAHSKSILGQFGVNKQVRVKTAEWRDKGFGTNEYEAILLSRLMAATDGSTLTHLMRAYDALKSNGMVIVHTYLLDNDLNGGGEATFRYLMQESCTLEQLSSLLAEAGFERVAVLHRHPTEGDLLVGYKGNEPLLQEPTELVEVATPELTLVGTGGNEHDEDVILATHRRAWSGVERLN
jgi:hypothetical protein